MRWTTSWQFSIPQIVVLDFMDKQWWNSTVISQNLSSWIKALTRRVSFLWINAHLNSIHDTCSLLIYIFIIHSNKFAVNFCWSFTFGNKKFITTHNFLFIYYFFISVILVEMHVLNNTINAILAVTNSCAYFLFRIYRFSSFFISLQNVGDHDSSYPL